MPTVSRFYGIVISIYYGDHAPPHFHARYAEYRSKVAINTLVITEGGLPHRAESLVLEWAALRRTELYENWQRAQDGLPLEPIAPLD
jgi:hypothetical protein